LGPAEILGWVVLIGLGLVVAWAPPRVAAQHPTMAEWADDAKAARR
jgi:hypothetical protein